MALRPKQVEATAQSIDAQRATMALDQAYDAWWYWVLDQLDSAFVTDEAMLERIIFRTKARMWSRTADPMKVCNDPGGIVDAVQAIELEVWQLDRCQEEHRNQCNLRDRLAEALGVPAVGNWRVGTPGTVVRRKCHYAGTLLHEWGKARKPPFDPYAKRTGMDDPAKQQAADQVAKEWTT